MKHTITYQSVPRETFTAVDRLVELNKSAVKEYINLLLWWNKRINLISRGVSRETLWEYIRHSLLLGQISSFRQSDLIIDAGTGGGLPGIPLALTNSEKHFLLNDIVTKKIWAVKQLVRKLKLKNIQTFGKSVGELRVARNCIVVSKHAFKMDALYQLTGNLPWTSIIFYKGIDFKQELSRIETPLSIRVYDLSECSSNLFYSRRALIEIER